MRTKLLLIGAVVLLAAVLSAGIAIAASSGGEEPLTGSTLEQATDAALAHTGGGTVVETETGDDGAAYSVEVQLDDGSQVEVNLNADFEVVGSEADDDSGPDDDDGAGDDD
ncbi:MAG TPA: PepSY domain-containing protein [Gaiellaceae bacterium]|nr:PepSY domain-containing protein [Gaiellaceae bacterium]